MESFFASLKKELTHGENYATREGARASIFEYIEVFFNRVRRHSSLGYLSPAEYERAGLSRRPPSVGKSSSGPVGRGSYPARRGICVSGRQQVAERKHPR